MTNADLIKEDRIYCPVYRQYELDLDKVNSVDDCKKILKFICDLTLKPVPEQWSYDFGDAGEYFKYKEFK